MLRFFFCCIGYGCDSSTHAWARGKAHEFNSFGCDEKKCIGSSTTKKCLRHIISSFAAYISWCVLHICIGSHVIHISRGQHRPRTQPTHSLFFMQSADAKKEEFRKYLEKSGVIDALTKALVGLYEEPERPQSAVEYVRKYLGSSSTANVDVDALRNENEEMRNRIRELSRTVDDLRKTNSSR